MTPQKKAISQIDDSTATSKDKKIINGRMGPTDLHPSNPDDVHERVNEKPLSLATTPERA